MHWMAVRPQTFPCIVPLYALIKSHVFGLLGVIQLQELECLEPHEIVFGHCSLQWISDSVDINWLLHAISQEVNDREMHVVNGLNYILENYHSLSFFCIRKIFPASLIYVGNMLISMDKYSSEN